MNISIGCLAIRLLLTLAAAAHATSAPAETVLIRFRFPEVVCVGVCPNFEMKVGPHGDVVTRELWDEPRTYHWRAAPAKLDAFRRALFALRPAGEIRLDSRCEIMLPDGKADPMANNPRPDDLEVRWTGGPSEARLTACYANRGPTRKAVQDALRALGADPYFGRRGEAYPTDPSE